MVLNLCLPHFQTSIQCNKLCADGYDVSNLLSGDPRERRSGFKLEYFLRPPVHVTLSFRVEMELCRLDVELWPWGMDQGRSSRRIEILACSKHGGPFQLVSRCDLQEELQVCFPHPAFRPRDPFPEPPPPPPTGAKAQELWSRGSLGSVAQLRIGIPYSGAASALGIKSLAVWASPSRGCPASELEKIRYAHLNSFATTNPSTDVPPKPDPVITTDIPEEFLDPLTQELMVFPMILPSGMSIDNSTLEEYQKREATWGRQPNDPFTGVPFSQSSKPLPNPLLKGRIDRLALQTGCTGVGSRNNQLTKPQPSRLTSAEVTDSGRNCIPHGSVSGPTHSRSTKRKHDSSSPSSSADPGRAPVRKPLHTPSEPDSHERRLADSLDQALNAALHGLPVFTSPSEGTSCGDASAGLDELLGHGNPFHEALSALFLSSSEGHRSLENCPRGGKRSQPDAIRQCMACGPGNKGRCFGPSICCGAGLGCLVGSPETLTCMEENLLPGPCESGGMSCGSEGGVCAAPGVCCDSGGCALDPECSEDVRLRPDEDSGALKSVSGEMLLHLLNLASRRQRPF